MKQPEDLKRELVGQWLTKAEKDFVAAGILLESNPFVLGVVGFLAQQAVEKYLKAYLAWKQVYFPKTHNIAALLVLVSEVNQTLGTQLMSARTLSQYAVESRYPGDIPELTQGEAAAAFKLAESVRDAVRKALGDVVR